MHYNVKVIAHYDMAQVQKITWFFLQFQTPIRICEHGMVCPLSMPLQGVRI